MSEILIDLLVVIAVLGLSYETGEMLVRLLLTAIEPTGEKAETIRSGLNTS